MRPPVIVTGEPSAGWPEWCTGFVSMAPREAVQAHQDVLAVMVAMMVAKQMGLVAGGPNIDLHQAATVTACAAEHGIRPQLNPETIRRILKGQRRAAGQADGPLPGGADQRLSPN